MHIKEELRPGDIIFIRINNFLYRRVASSTASWTSHVGMIHSQINGEWYVAESAVPFSKMSSLSSFIQRSENNRFAIRRLKAPLTPEDTLALQRAADQRMNKLYHLGFKYNSGRYFCSKFVHEIFKEVKGIDIGDKETFRELLTNNPEISQTFWRIWFFGRIPWERETVTPASQYRSPLLENVLENEKPE